VRCLAAIESAEGNCSAFVPDLAGCVATGKTPADTKEAIREAVAMHVRGLREDGREIPEASASAERIEID
jgi:predicted RNase H-like HicB family nuclease